MKSFFGLIALSAVMLTGWCDASAENFTVGGINYTSITDPSGSANGTCKVDWQTQGISGDVVIPDNVTYGGKVYDVVEIANHAFDAYDYYDIEITSLKIGNKVTKIGSSACADQYYLRSVTFGENVETIGGSAFSECSLESVVLPSKLKSVGSNVFYNNKSMRSVTLNEGLEEIKSFAFYKCNNLTTLDIPASLTSIDFVGNAFGGCTNLQAINVAQGNTSYSSASGIVYNAAGTELIFCPAALAAENLTFPAALTKIGTNAFKNNTSIKTVTFPASLTEIGNDAFSGCTGITTLAFPASLQKIGEYAFSGCTGVYDIALNEGLQTVEISAFKGCTALTTIKIPASVTTWKWSATINCTNLAAFEVAAGSTSYHTDGPSLIEDATATLLQYAPAAPAQYYKVPDGVTKINAFAFDGVKALKILDTNQVSEIGNDAICVLDELTDLTLGAATSALGGGAVELCPKLQNIRLYSTMIPEWAGSRAPFSISMMENVNLYVPDVAVPDYKQDMLWCKFVNILPMSQAPEIDVPGSDPSPVAHAYQMGSENYKWGFVHFPADDLSSLTIDKATYENDDQIGAGEYVDGKYYTYTLSYDAYLGDGLEPADFAVYNAADFSLLRSVPTDMPGRVVDMAYDYVHNVMYALVEEGRGQDSYLGKTRLCIVDLTTGSLTPVGDPGDITAQNGYGNTVEEHLVALAADPADGQLYAMGEYRQLYKLDSTTGLASAVGARNRVAIYNDFQSMAFAPNGKLYHVQRHPDYEYFMEINPLSGDLINPVTGQPVTVNADFTNNAARFPNDPQLTGLYFEGHNYVNVVPQAVGSLKAKTSDDNPHNINLTWTLPTTNGDSSAATLRAIRIYRLGAAGRMVEITPDRTSYTDTGVPDGDIYYLVAAVSADGQGFPATATAFGGADQLKAVTDLTATLDGKEVTLTWTAPTETVSGGHTDFDNITYTVLMKRGSEASLAAENVTATSCKVSLSANGVYTFVVTPRSCGVEGLPAESNQVTLEGTESLPYATGFEDADGGTLWTAINVSEGYGTGWSIQTGYAYQQLDGKFAQFKTGGSDYIPAADWFISPLINCPAGKYELTYYQNGGSFDTHSYKVFILPVSVNVNDADKEIYSVENAKIYTEEEINNHYVPVKIEFTLEAAGENRIAFKGIGASTYATLKFDNLRLNCVEPAGVENVTATESAPIILQGNRAICEGADEIAAFDLAGRLVTRTDGDTLILAPGTYIVRAGAAVAKVIIR